MEIDDKKTCRLCLEELIDSKLEDFNISNTVKTLFQIEVNESSERICDECKGKVIVCSGIYKRFKANNETWNRLVQNRLSTTVPCDPEPSTSVSPSVTPVLEHYYTVLRVSGIHSEPSDEFIRETLLRKYKRFGNPKVNISFEYGERVAYMSFGTSEDAREAKQAKPSIVFHNKIATVEPFYDPPPSIIQPKCEISSPPKYDTFSENYFYPGTFISSPSQNDDCDPHHNPEASNSVPKVRPLKNMEANLLTAGPSIGVSSTFPSRQPKKKNFVCKFCKKGFVGMNGMQNHIIKMHSQGKTKQKPKQRPQAKQTQDFLRNLCPNTFENKFPKQ